MTNRIFASVSTTLVTIATCSLVPALAATTQTYTVRPGDSLYTISVREGVTLSALEAANRQIQNFNNILPGETINLPESASSSLVTTTSITTASAPTTLTSVTAKRNAIVNTAESLLGIPYSWGGDTPSMGFDCSGFVEYVFSKNGISLPRESHDQATVGTPVAQNALLPGDLLFFVDTDSLASDYANHVTHVGIYIGGGAMIESTSANNRGVVIVRNVFSNPYYTSHYYGARNVIH